MKTNYHSNFVITGHGRSGTKFLANLMNKSSKWTVFHEPGEKKLHTNFSKVQDRFNKDFYGEVNSFLRNYIFKIKVKKKGIIIRNPVDIWISIANRNDESRWFQKIKELKQTFDIISKASNRKDIKLIQFKSMTEDLEYLRDTINYFGINDINLEESDLNKVNETIEFKYKNIDEFPRSIIKPINRLYVKFKTIGG